MACVDVDLVDLDDDMPTSRHRVSSVYDEVHDHLFELRPVCGDVDRVGSEHVLQLRIFADHALQEPFASAYDLVQVDRLIAQDLLAAEREQLMCQCGGSRCAC